MTTTELWDTDEVRKAAADAFRKWYEDPSSGLVDDAVGAAIAPIIARNARVKPLPDDRTEIAGILVSDNDGPRVYWQRIHHGWERVVANIVADWSVLSWIDEDGRWWDAEPQP